MFLLRCKTRLFSFLFIPILLLKTITAYAAAPAIPFTINMSEPVAITGNPRIILDVDGSTRYATYSSGTGTSTLTFTYTATIGDVDLNGISISSNSIDLNGGTVQDLSGNALANLTFTAPNTTNIKVNYPSLSMDFVYDADGRYTLNGIAYNDLSSFLTAAGGTYGRGSQATYYDSNGVMQTASNNVPRFVYDPVSHVFKGILIEANATNYMRRSEEIDNALWTPQNSTVTSNITTSPKSATTAEAIIPDGTNNTHGVTYSGVDISFTSNFTVSVFAKAAGYNYAYISVFENSLNRYAVFNLSTCTAGTTKANITTTFTETIGNGWCRIGFSMPTPTRTTANISLNVTTGDNITTFTGDASSGVYFWGAQLEAYATKPTSYIATTASTASRNIDSLIIPSGGASWANGNTNTIYANFYHNGYGFGCPTMIDNGAFYAQIFTNGLTNLWNRINTGGASTILSRTVAGDDQPIKNAYGWNTTSVASSINGAAATTGTYTGPMGFSNLYIGGCGIYNQLQRAIRKVSIYPVKISNTQLQLLTQ